VEKMCQTDEYSKGKANGSTIQKTKQCTVCSTRCTPDVPPQQNCHPLRLICSTKCGALEHCSPDGCGGKSCCPATDACKPKPSTLPPVCDKTCPAGTMCYQPINKCPSGAYCAQALPICATIAPSPTQCSLRSQGDANCDNVINDADYVVIKLKIKGGIYTSTNHSADFNNDGKVDLVDYEIWRNTVKH